MKWSTRVASLIVTAALLANGGVALGRAADVGSALDPDLAASLRALAPGQRVGAIVILKVHADVGATDGRDRAERQRRVIEALQSAAAAGQAGLSGLLDRLRAEGRVEAIAPLWIVNAIALRADRAALETLAQSPQVRRIEADATFQAPSRSPGAPGDEQTAVEPNLQMIRAPAAWARGVTGKGVVVGLLDTGVSLDSPDLTARWRGGSNSWFDPYGEQPDAPVDTQGHGTQMLGVILGGSAGAARIGVAPDAQWIAARVFDNRGRATISAVHRALQWVLDPDGNPATPDAPQVVNNSWSFVNAECSAEFDADLRALRAAGILPVFAAGVRDPIGPADTAEAFAVGALADDHTLTDDSARGPSKCNAASPVYPQIVAPGKGITTTDLYGGYLQVDGTSIAAAHVSGALALLLSARPGLSADEQASILTGAAVDLGPPGPDDEFGYGRLDVAAMLDRALGAAPGSTVAPVQVASPAAAPGSTVAPVQVAPPAAAPGSPGVAVIAVAVAVLAVLALMIGWRARSRR